MSTDEMKALYRRVIEALNRRDLDAAAALTAPNAVNHNPLPGEPSGGPEGLRYRMGVFFTAFPDARFTIEEIIAEGDIVTTRGRITGTNTGPFSGMPPTGKAVNVAYFDMLRVANGQFVEHWVVLDQLGMLHQLGALPAPEQAAA